MKKIIAVVLAIVSIIALSGCGNMSIGLGEFEFHKVHVDTPNCTGCFTIEKWYTDDRGIEIKTKEAGNMFLSEGTYMMFSNECPLCK